MVANLIITDAVREELRQIVFMAVDDALNARKAKDSLLKTEDVIQAYGVSRTTLWRMVKAGKLHAYQGRGRQQLFNADECKRVLIKESAKAENK